MVWETVEWAADSSPVSVEVEAEEESDEEVLEERQETKVVEISRPLPLTTFTPRQVDDVWYNQLEVTPEESGTYRGLLYVWAHTHTHVYTYTHSNTLFHILTFNDGGFKSYTHPFTLLQGFIFFQLKLFFCLSVRVVEPYSMETREEEMEVYQSAEQTFESKTVITRRITTLVTVTEERREGEVTVMEESNIFTESAGDYITLEVKRPLPAVRHIEDDWFRLLEATPVEIKPSPSGSVLEEHFSKTFYIHFQKNIQK